MRELEHERDEVEGDEEAEEEQDVLRHGRIGLLDARQRGLAGEEVAVGLDRGDAVCDLAALGGAPAPDLAAVRSDRRLDLRARALQLRRRRRRAAGVAPEIGPASELVRLRAGREAGLAVGEEAAVRDPPLEVRLLDLRSSDLLLSGGDLRVVRARDLVRRGVNPRSRRLAQLVVDR